MKTELPTYQQAADEVRDSAKPSALAWFITEQEPGNVVEEAKFRRELEAVISEAEKSGALAKQSQMEQEFAESLATRELAQIEYLRDIWKNCSDIAFWNGHAVGMCTGGALVLLTWLAVRIVF